jgi:hypothetical protein
MRLPSQLLSTNSELAGGAAAPPRASATTGESSQVPTTPPTRTDTSRFRGSLTLTSIPSQALVTINGRRSGQTPLVLRNLPIGSRAVQLKVDGYELWSRSVIVAANRDTRVSATLLRLRDSPLSGVVGETTGAEIATRTATVP